MTGYYKMARGWMDHPCFQNEPYTEREAWAWLIERAGWQDRTHWIGRRGVPCKRGQLAVSVRYLASAWSWSKSRVGRFLQRLKIGSMIGTEGGSECSVITICNYDKYQAAPECVVPAAGRSVGHERDTSGTKKKNQLNELNESEKEVLPSEAFDSDAISETVGLWNEMAARVGLALVANVTEARRKHLRARLRDCGGIEGIRAALAKLEASSFLNGSAPRNGRHESWMPDFDFFVSERGFTRLLEGAYDDDRRRVPPRNGGGAGKAERSASALADLPVGGHS